MMISNVVLIITKNYINRSLNYYETTKISFQKVLLAIFCMFVSKMVILLNNEVFC